MRQHSSLHKTLSLELYTPLTSATSKLITVVLLCSSLQRDQCKLLCHLIILPVIPKKKSTPCVYPLSALPVFVLSVNVSLPRGVGVFIRLPAEIQPSRKRVTWRCFDPQSRLRLLFLAPWRHCLNSVWGGFPTVWQRNPSVSPISSH